MAYTAQFFAEKLNCRLEYLNPFRNVQIDPAINLEELAPGVAHSFGEVVGLGLRNVAQCPVEMNLMPRSSLQRQQFNQKKPYFAATLCSLVLVVLAYGWFYSQMASLRRCEDGYQRAGRAAETDRGPAPDRGTELTQFKSESSQLLNGSGSAFSGRMCWANWRASSNKLKPFARRTWAAWKMASGSSPSPRATQA